MRGDAREEAFHILPPDERHVLTEALSIQLDQSMTMVVFFAGHGE